MAVFDAWVVAAAVLLRHEGSMHFESISDAVQDSQLTKLGNKGFTAKQTMGTILRTKQVEGKDIFRRVGRGIYELASPDFVSGLNLVQAALNSLSSKG